MIVLGQLWTSICLGMREYFNSFFGTDWLGLSFDKFNLLRLNTRFWFSHVEYVIGAVSFIEFITIGCIKTVWVV